MELLDEALVRPYLTDTGNYVEKEVLNAELANLLARLSESDKLNVAEKWFPGVEKAWEKFTAAMGKLKDFSRTGAHPTKTLDDEAVDAVMAKRLVDDKMPKGRPPAPRKGNNSASAMPQWSDSELKALVKTAIDKLEAVRREKEQEDFLIA